MILKRNLRYRCRGADVVEVQILLMNHGYDLGKAGADGKFGRLTRKAVKAFQKAMGLTVDGVVGPLTIAKLETADSIQVTHFKDSEFVCHHCGKLPRGGISRPLLILLERVRSAIGDKPIIISSGYRCWDHNRAIKGALFSQHLYGHAADIRVKGMESGAEYERLYQICSDLNPDGGVGYYPGDGFIHMDDRGRRARWRG